MRLNYCGNGNGKGRGRGRGRERGREGEGKEKGTRLPKDILDRSHSIVQPLFNVTKEAIN